MHKKGRNTLNSVKYRELQSEYCRLAYFSALKKANSMRLIARFRCGCHGLQVNLGKWVKGIFVDHSEWYCPVCKVDVAEDENHFLCQSPACDSIWAKYDATF